MIFIEGGGPSQKSLVNMLVRNTLNRHGFRMKAKTRRALLNLTVRFSDRLRTAAGQAQVTSRESGEAIIDLHSRLFHRYPQNLTEIFLHELAHVIADLEHGEPQHHNSNWTRWCLTIGASAAVYHRMDVDEYRLKCA